jgi:hypothetical protein
LPTTGTLNQGELLSRAHAVFLAARTSDHRARIDKKIEDLRHYDVVAMDRVVAICHWGRSGSHLLASYLDGHDNILMLPSTRGTYIYSFFERYPSLSCRDKLMAYPVFTNEFFNVPFFHGDWFPIAAADYQAAVDAIFEIYGNWSEEFLESRRGFFQLVHVAYSVALGWRPATPQPTMVYAQHDWNEVKARRLVEDFPQARFVHTVRDPISSFDRLFEWRLGASAEQPRRALHVSMTIPLQVARLLVETDGPHPGMESRSRAIRFEDLHLNTAETLARLVDWLGLSFQTKLCESTFNYGLPFIVERDGEVWSGQRAKQAQRHSKNISFTDRALIFALLYENFATWDYPYPKIFNNKFIRVVVCLLLLPIPTKMEGIIARAVLKYRRPPPSVPGGNFRLGLNRVLGMLYCRLKFISLVATECFRRTRTRKIPLQPCAGRRRSDY